jgi:hypothetical protein
LYDAPAGPRREAQYFDELTGAEVGDDEEEDVEEPIAE